MLNVLLIRRMTSYSKGTKSVSVEIAISDELIRHNLSE